MQDFIFGRFATVALAFGAGLSGGFLANHLGSRTALAEVRSPSSVAGAADVVTAKSFRLIDASGKARAALRTLADGAVGLFFYDSQGRNRLELGLYSPAESEYPFVVLNDSKQLAAGIFRLYGGKEAPVVVLKSGGADRAIFGLNADSLEPFLVSVDGSGRKQAYFGKF